jgi:hypothetical protein
MIDAVDLNDHMAQRSVLADNRAATNRVAKKERP